VAWTFRTEWKRESDSSVCITTLSVDPERVCWMTTSVTTTRQSPRATTSTIRRRLERPLVIKILSQEHRYEMDRAWPPEGPKPANRAVWDAGAGGTARTRAAGVR